MIRPIDMQMILPRTESVGNMQQHEIQHTANVNSNAASEVVKQEQRLSETVVKKEEKQFDTFQYDAREEGKGSYSGSKRKKKSPQKEKNDKFFGAEKSEYTLVKEEDSQPRINFQI